MSQLKWNDDIKYSILQLKMNLSVENFKIAGPSLGLQDRDTKATKKPAKNITTSDIQSHKAFRPTHDYKNLKSKPRKLVKPAQGLNSHPITAKTSFLDYLSFKIASIFVDAVLVLLTLAVILFLAGVIIDPYGLSSNMKVLQNWWSYRFIKDVGSSGLLLGFGAVYLTYWTLFKLFVGTTLSSFLVAGKTVK